MAKILLISDNIDIQTVVQTTLLNDEFIVSANEVTILDVMKVEAPDIVMIDTDIASLDLRSVYRNIKGFDTIILLLAGENELLPDMQTGAHLFVSLPINPIVLKSAIAAGLKVRKSLKKLSTSNRELANSLYQLNVLYGTSSRLAGSLNREKLINIMNDGIDRALNSNVSCTLSFKDKQKPVLLINSNYKLSSRLVEALKLRAVLNYRNSHIDNTEVFSIDDIEVEETVKYSINEYDFEILNYQKLLSYITVDDKCWGYSEIFREKEFSSDDAKCFQTLVNQVTLPLKSAILYQEITGKNIKLAKLERLKSEFISIVSHELKTPLTSIKNSLDIVSCGRTGIVTGQMMKFLDMAKRNVKKLSKIINDLLDMSKIEAGKMDYLYKKTSLAPVIGDVKLSLSQLAGQKNLSLNISIDDNLLDVYADTDRIEQVLTNLVSNAIKFSPENGEINITAGVVNAADIKADECFTPQISKLNGEYVQVCVRDAGIGIEKPDFVHVFDKFEQIENSLSREVGGSGLGLSIAKQLITAHNGAIWCDSVINKGSSFYFVIPAANEKNRFMLAVKQLAQEAKAKNTSLIVAVLKSKQDSIKYLSGEDVLFDGLDKKDGCIYEENSYKFVKLAFFDSDIKSVRVIEDRIGSLLSLQKEKYGKCDIIYSYEVEEVSDEKNSYY
ncbi:MAG: hybrid sensor histidine kinase/response regulator [Candidatus Gastranaerophilales bacterium]|nr:hybrid sensor histidine kinase/response regulator [Candidatus Gastranaerophilales bacterium]